MEVSLQLFTELIDSAERLKRDIFDMAKLTFPQDKPYQIFRRFGDNWSGSADIESALGINFEKYSKKFDNSMIEARFVNSSRIVIEFSFKNSYEGIRQFGLTLASVVEGIDNDALVIERDDFTYFARELQICDNNLTKINLDTLGFSKPDVLLGPYFKIEIEKF